MSAEVTMYGSNPEFTNAAQQQSVRKVTGTIKDELGEGMVGVNILLKGTNTGTTSDYDGNFSIEVPPNVFRIYINRISTGRVYHRTIPILFKFKILFISIIPKPSHSFFIRLIHIEYIC